MNDTEHSQETIPITPELETLAQEQAAMSAKLKVLQEHRKAGIVPVPIAEICRQLRSSSGAFIHGYPFYSKDRTELIIEGIVELSTYLGNDAFRSVADAEKYLGDFLTRGYEALRKWRWFRGLSKDYAYEIDYFAQGYRQLDGFMHIWRVWLPPEIVDPNEVAWCQRNFESWRQHRWPDRPPQIDTEETLNAMRRLHERLIEAEDRAPTIKYVDVPAPQPEFNSTGALIAGAAVGYLTKSSVLGSLAGAALSGDGVSGLAGGILGKKLNQK